MQDPKFKKFQKLIMDHLSKLEEKEPTEKEIQKAFAVADIMMMRKGRGMPVGTIREWKGKKYIKIAPGKWKPKYDNLSRGAKMSIAFLKKKVASCTNSEELLNLVMDNKARFSDEKGNPLPFIKELSDYVAETKKQLESSSNAPKAEEPKEDKKEPEQETAKKETSLEDKFRKMMDKIPVDERKKKLEVAVKRGGERGEIAKKMLKELEAKEAPKEEPQKEQPAEKKEPENKYTAKDFENLTDKSDEELKKLFEDNKNAGGEIGRLAYRAKAEIARRKDLEDEKKKKESIDKTEYQDKVKSMVKEISSDKKNSLPMAFKFREDDYKNLSKEELEKIANSKVMTDEEIEHAITEKIFTRAKNFGKEYTDGEIANEISGLIFKRKGKEYASKRIKELEDQTKGILEFNDGSVADGVLSEARHGNFLYQVKKTFGKVYGLIKEKLSTGVFKVVKNKEFENEEQVKKWLNKEAQKNEKEKKQEEPEETEAEKHENRSNAMKGNQNAKKDGVTEEEKDRLFKEYRSLDLSKMTTDEIMKKLTEGYEKGVSKRALDRFSDEIGKRAKFHQMENNKLKKTKYGELDFIQSKSENGTKQLEAKSNGYTFRIEKLFNEYHTEFTKDEWNNKDFTTLENFKTLKEAKAKLNEYFLGRMPDIQDNEVEALKTKEQEMKESEAEKHQNRSDAMKGNQNAKKNGVQEDEKKGRTKKIEFKTLSNGNIVGDKGNNSYLINQSQDKKYVAKEFDSQNKLSGAKTCDTLEEAKEWAENISNIERTPDYDTVSYKKEDLRLNTEKELNEMMVHDYEIGKLKNAERIRQELLDRIEEKNKAINEIKKEKYGELNFEEDKSSMWGTDYVSTLKKDGNSYLIRKKNNGVYQAYKPGSPYPMEFNTFNEAKKHLEDDWYTTLPDPTDKEISKKVDFPMGDKSKPKRTLEDIKKNYTSQKSIKGNRKTVVLPNGEKMKCYYKLVEADAPTASHDENTFEMTEGFPTNENGKTVNDRDYKNDQSAQESVISMAQKFNASAIENPPIVTKDGIVISGNNRTMSSKLSAKNGTDKAYLEDLGVMVDEFGLDKDDLKEFKHPRLILEVDEDHKGNYTTEEFAMFNQNDKKTMSNVEKAVKLTKTLKSQNIADIAETVSQYDTMSDLYQDEKGSQDFIQKLVLNGIIGENERAQFLSSDGLLNDTGKDFAETVLVGSVLDENNLRALDEPGGKRIRQKLVRAILPLVENKGTGKEYSFNSELNKAVNVATLVVKNHDKYKSVKAYFDQLPLFEEEQLDDATKKLAELIHDEGEKAFAQRMKNLGAGLRDSANGQQDIFLDNVETKSSLMARFLEIKKSLNTALNRFISVAQHFYK